MFPMSDRYGDMDLEDLDEEGATELAPEDGRVLNFTRDSSRLEERTFEEDFSRELDEALAEQEGAFLDQVDLEEIEEDYQAYLRSHNPDDL